MPEGDLRKRTEQLFRYLNDLADRLNTGNTELKNEIEKLREGTQSNAE